MVGGGGGGVKRRKDDDRRVRKRGKVRERKFIMKCIRKLKVLRFKFYVSLSSLQKIVSFSVGCKIKRFYD